MSKFLVDSDIVIWFLKGRGKEEELLRQLSVKGDLFISVVTITEVRAGLGKNAGKIISELKQLFQPIALDSQMAELAGSYRRKYNLGIADMLIAATTVVSSCTFVTYNKKHFPMSKIKLYKSTS